MTRVGSPQTPVARGWICGSRASKPTEGADTEPSGFDHDEDAFGRGEREGETQENGNDRRQPLGGLRFGSDEPSRSCARAGLMEIHTECEGIRFLRVRLPHAFRTLGSLHRLIFLRSSAGDGVELDRRLWSSRRGPPHLPLRQTLVHLSRGCARCRLRYIGGRPELLTRNAMR